MFSSWYPDFPSTDAEDIHTVIKDVTEDAAAQDEKIAAEESAKGATEDAAKEHVEEPHKGPSGEAGKAAAKEVVFDDLPSSFAASGSGRYLRVSDALFVHLLGASSTRAPLE